MIKVPSENKHFIRSQYVRYRELRALSSELSSISSLGDWCFWGGIVIACVWLIRIAVGAEFPNISVGVGFGVFVVGGLIRMNWKSKDKDAYSEMFSIERDLKERGVILSGLGDKVSMYYQSIEEGSEFNPLSDEAFE